MRKIAIIKRNIAVTTSGACDPAALIAILQALGEDNVMFSVDYPYEDPQVASDFIESAPISEDVRAKGALRSSARSMTGRGSRESAPAHRRWHAEPRDRRDGVPIHRVVGLVGCKTVHGLSATMKRCASDHR